jgi:hypothetical protein
LEKLTEAEYNTLADEITVKVRAGELTLDDYHAQLIELASRRASADNKPEVLIRSVTFQKYGNSEIANGYALNHPRLGRTHVTTSLVVSHAEDGSSFETLNTRYIIVPRLTVDAEDVNFVETVGQPDAVVHTKMPLSKTL